MGGVTQWPPKYATDRTDKYMSPHKGELSFDSVSWFALHLKEYLQNHNVNRKVYLHVTLGGILAIKEGFWSHPFDR